MCTYDPTSGIFENSAKAEDLPIQSPVPLSKEFPYFLVTQEEVSPKDGKGASVGLATLSVRSKRNTIIIKKKRNKRSSFEAIETIADLFIIKRLLYLVRQNEK